MSQIARILTFLCYNRWSVM